MKYATAVTYAQAINILATDGTEVVVRGLDGTDTEGGSYCHLYCRTREIALSILARTRGTSWCSGTTPGHPPCLLYTGPMEEILRSLQLTG